MTMMPYLEEMAGEVVHDPRLLAGVANQAGRTARYVARGFSGARARARKRRTRQRTRRGTQVMAVSRTAPYASMAPASRVVSSNNLALAPREMAPQAITQTIRQNYAGLDNYRVAHSEYVQDISGSLAFLSRSFRINPGDRVTFPWLSQIAPNFEKYRFNKLVFYLKPQAPTTARGVLMAALDYDVTDPAPTSKASVLQYDGVTRTAPWNDCRLDTKRMSGPRFVSVTAAQDPGSARLNDFGNLFVCSSGQEDDSVVSELWVEYEVDLITPQASTVCNSWSLYKSPWTENLFTEASWFLGTAPTFAPYEGGTSSSVVCTTPGTYLISMDVFFSDTLALETENGSLSRMFINGNSVDSLSIFSFVSPGYPINPALQIGTNQRFAFKFEVGDYLTFDINGNWTSVSPLELVVQFSDVDLSLPPWNTLTLARETFKSMCALNLSLTGERKATQPKWQAKLKERQDPVDGFDFDGAPVDSRVRVVSSSHYIATPVSHSSAQGRKSSAGGGRRTDDRAQCVDVNDHKTPLDDERLGEWTVAHVEVSGDRRAKTGSKPA